MVCLVLAETTIHGFCQTVVWGIVVGELVVADIVLDHSVVLELFTQGPVQMEDPQHLEGSESTGVILHRLK